YVDLGALALGIGIDDARGSGPFLLLRLGFVIEHGAHVVGVGDGQVAGSRQDVLDAFAIATGRRIGQVIAYARQPGTRRIQAMCGDPLGNQADIVGMVTRAGADAALPFGTGNILIGQRRGIDPILRDIEYAGAQRQSRPVVVVIAEG